MEKFPFEIKEKLWTDLPIEDILSLCETSLEFNQICNDIHTWKFLLMRDFGIKYNGNDPKIKYIVEHTKRKTISNIKKKKKIFALAEVQLPEVNFLIRVIADSDDKNYLYQVILEQFINNEIESETLQQSIAGFLEDKNIDIPTVADIKNFVMFTPYYDVEVSDIDGIR